MSRGLRYRALDQAFTRISSFFYPGTGGNEDATMYVIYERAK